MFFQLNIRMGVICLLKLSVLPHLNVHGVFIKLHDFTKIYGAMYQNYVKLLLKYYFHWEKTWGILTKIYFLNGLREFHGGTGPCVQSLLRELSYNLHRPEKKKEKKKFETWKFGSKCLLKSYQNISIFILVLKQLKHNILG